MRIESLCEVFEREAFPVRDLDMLPERTSVQAARFEVGKAVADDEFLVADLLWILAAQSASYVAGAVSWVFAERAGFRCYGRYMLRDANTRVIVAGTTSTGEALWTLGDAEAYLA